MSITCLSLVGGMLFGVSGLVLLLAVVIVPVLLILILTLRDFYYVIYGIFIIQGKKTSQPPTVKRRGLKHKQIRTIGPELINYSSSIIIQIYT